MNRAERRQKERELGTKRTWTRRPSPQQAGAGKGGWLEERGVSAEPSAHGLCLRIHTASLATWDTLATADVFRCYKTAAEAYDAAAKALGYPGLETAPEEGPSP